MIYAFIHVDWPLYFKIVGIGVLLYWVVIGLLFFRSSIRESIQRNRRPVGHPVVNIDSPFVREETAAAQEVVSQASLFPEMSAPALAEAPEMWEDEQFPLLVSLAEAVRDFILDAGEKQLVRGELMQGLRSLITEERFASLSDPGHRVAINNLVAVDAEDHCQIHFDAEELNQLWVPLEKKV